jgi:hypothetical protein
MERNVRGQIVVCKDFTGDLLERLVWEDSERLVFVHTESQFSAHERGNPHLEAVGFPIEDVFVRDEGDGGLKPYCPVTAPLSCN